MTGEHPESGDPLVSVLQDASTQTNHSNDTLPSSTPNSATDQTIEAGPLPPICPYQCYGRSKRTEIRGEIVERFHDVLSLYVHGDAEALNDLVNDLLESKKWTSTLRGSGRKEEDSLTGTFLSCLVKEYHTCRRKETNTVIRKNAKKIQQAIKISRTKSSSHVASQGNTPESFKTGIDAANSLGRLTTYSAEKKRLSCIVVADYPQTFLTELFKCSKSTVTAARVYRILFGRGGVPPHSLKFSRQCVSQETLDQIANFLLRDDIS